MKSTLIASAFLWLLLHIGAAHALGDLPPPDPKQNYQGLWWASPGGSEPGWGISISHQGDTLYATWFTYDADGSALWLVMPNTLRRGYDWMNDTYSGPIYRSTGPAFDANPWDPAAVHQAEVGTAVFQFRGSHAGTFTYIVNGASRSKDIERQVFSARLPSCTTHGIPGPSTNYTDLWSSEPGWGLHVDHQGDVIFATWFTYRADGHSDWVVMPNATRTDESTYSGALYRLRGPRFDAVPWNPREVSVAAVGRARIAFRDNFDYYENTDNGWATFEYTLDGISRTETIERQVFSNPVSVCR